MDTYFRIFLFNKDSERDLLNHDYDYFLTSIFIFIIIIIIRRKFWQK
jgi:hypothetical protein